MSELNKKIEKLISEYDKNMEIVINRVINRNKKQRHDLFRNNSALSSVNTYATSNNNILHTVELTSLLVDSDECIDSIEVISSKSYDSGSNCYDYCSRESYSSSSYSDSSSSNSSYDSYSYDSGSSYSGGDY